VYNQSWSVLYGKVLQIQTTLLKSFHKNKLNNLCQTICQYVRQSVTITARFGTKCELQNFLKSLIVLRFRVRLPSRSPASVKFQPKLRPCKTCIMFIKIHFNYRGERTQGERVPRANGPNIF
jgi:hypothetical protein